MRFSSAVAGLVLLFAPSLATAQSSWGSSGSWTTTTEYQATTTVTMTLLQVNATVTSHLPHATGFNGSSTYTASGATYNPATVNPSATPSVCSNCMQSSGASGSPDVNMAVAALAGAAVFAWGSL